MSNSIQIRDELAKSIQALLSSAQKQLPAPPSGDEVDRDLRDIQPDDPLLALNVSAEIELDLPSEFVEAFAYASRCGRMAQSHNIKAEELEAKLASYKRQVEIITRLMEKTESLISLNSP
uniref:Uncharacterized protein n=1 Tax=Trichuris muris TaxID=70415 RepID=A0A5S6QU81_TRIMR